MSLRIHHVPARQGVRWVNAGFALFLRHALGFALLFFVGLVPTLVLALVPYIGTLLAFVMGPIITLAYAVAAKAARSGEPVRATHMFAPFLAGADASRRNALLGLSVVYTLATAAALMLVSELGGEALDKLMAIARSGHDDTLQQIQVLVSADPQLRWLGLLPGLLIGLISLVFWHAPMLVWWEGQGVAQSLFSSALACWRNKGAFALYTIAWVGVTTLFVVASSMVFMLVGAPQLVVLAWQPGMLLLVMAFYVSVFFTYEDSFRSDEPTSA